jgi:hypothetical protein
VSPSTPDTERTKAHVKRPKLVDLEMTSHALRGIFWALNMLVVHRVADGIAPTLHGATGLTA